MLTIKPTHKPIKQYYAELKEYEQLGEQNEGTVRTAFQSLLQHYARQADLTLLCEKTHTLPPDKGLLLPTSVEVKMFGFQSFFQISCEVSTNVLC